MKLSQAASAVKEVFATSVTQSAPTNTHVELSSQSSPEPVPNHGEKDGDGNLPELISVKGDRARALKEIADRRNAQAIAEGNEDLPATDEDGNEAETAAPPTEQQGADLDAGTQEQQPDAGATTVAAQETPAAPAPPAPEEMRTLIIDGQSVQVPVSKIIDTGQRALQKELAADLRLNQASALLAEAKRIAENQQPAQQSQQTAIGDLNDDQLAELIQFGTREQATQAVKVLRSQNAIKHEEIVRAAQQAVAPQMAFEAAKTYAITEYGDILNDPDLGAIFLNRENALRKAGDQRGYVELYKAIGDDMRAKFNRPKPGAAATPPAAQPSTAGRTMAEKQAAKAQAPAAPRLASARLDGEGTQPRPPTRSEIIDRQRRARGFQPYSAQK